ncbi:MAG: hypothetical protein JSV19_01360 [Phycisphaerales bacterium]|nr:MAG: hypothetical protein JSV19_01360 [Phycisphaerales bacterium]
MADETDEMIVERRKISPAITDPILCHAGLGSGAAWRITRAQQSRFSTCVHITVDNRRQTKQYVVKLGGEQERQGVWVPSAEYEGLKTLWDASHGSTMLAVPEPVSFGADPPHVTTVYVSGESALAILKRGCRRWANPRNRLAAIDVCKRMGAWVNEKHRLTVRSASPYMLEEYVQFCRTRVDEIERFCGPSGRRIAHLARVWLDGLAADHPIGRCFPLQEEHVQQMDCTPQNFLLEPDGSLCGLDFDAFRWDSLWVDPCVFWSSLEYMSTNPLYSAQAVSTCWTAFAARLSVPPKLFMASHLKQTLAALAWVRNPDRELLHTESRVTNLRHRALIRMQVKLLRTIFGDAPHHVEERLSRRV